MTSQYAVSKEAHRIDFVQRFVWNDQDIVILRAPEREELWQRTCISCPAVGTHRLYDYEDDYSGGVPLCQLHVDELVTTADAPPDWVSQDPEEAWTGVGSAAGEGWHGLWFLFATFGKYTKDGVWPYESNAGG